MLFKINLNKTPIPHQETVKKSVAIYLLKWECYASKFKKIPITFRPILIFTE